MRHAYALAALGHLERVRLSLLDVAALADEHHVLTDHVDGHHQGLRDHAARAAAHKRHHVQVARHLGHLLPHFLETNKQTNKQTQMKRISFWNDET